MLGRHGRNALMDAYGNPHATRRQTTWKAPAARTSQIATAAIVIVALLAGLAIGEDMISGDVFGIILGERHTRVNVGAMLRLRLD